MQKDLFGISIISIIGINQKLTKGGILVEEWVREFKEKYDLDHFIRIVLFLDFSEEEILSICQKCGSICCFSAINDKKKRMDMRKML